MPCSRASIASSAASAASLAALPFFFLAYRAVLGRVADGEIGERGVLFGMTKVEDGETPRARRIVRRGRVSLMVKFYSWKRFSMYVKSMLFSIVAVVLYDISMEFYLADFMVYVLFATKLDWMMMDDGA